MLVFGEREAPKFSLQLSGFSDFGIMKSVGDGLLTKVKTVMSDAKGELVKECEHQRNTHYMVSASFDTEQRDGRELMKIFCDSKLTAAPLLRVKGEGDVFKGTPLDESGFGGWIFALSGRM